MFLGLGGLSALGLLVSGSSRLSSAASPAATAARTQRTLHPQKVGGGGGMRVFRAPWEEH